ncbi:glycosyltransferase family 4 protein [Aquimarina sp. 2201CG5-10]|uniref:glycosyltransferase n=1 Tax=Aquimarina callyspongiae TaxID=3098150 RepID=UPI002AB5A03B|nr:glycosyltransferase family 4 protein [Aquimarina sp. 2201CG5-10]MDY8136033.1 glycosyltransferase family 4 protein [Aquimarina sp. 2201CG5-10]
MSRSCDRIIANLRKEHTINVYHFTNKNKAFSVESQINGVYTSIPVFEDSSHTLNMLWAFIKNKTTVLESDILVSFGSNLCLKGMPLIANWLQKPLLTCFRGNDFDSAIFSNKKQDLLYALQNSSGIACVTKEKVERIKHMQLNTSVWYTPNSIHLEQWKILQSDYKLAVKYKEALNLDKKTTVIGLIGFLKQKKGIDFFISSLQKSQFINTVHLRIVGEIEPHLETLLITKNIEYSIVVPESQTELIANYLVCDLIAIPSIYDGMPNVIFEAAALEIPILASNAGGIPDILDQDNAFIFDVLSEKSLLIALSNFENISKTNLELKTKLLKSKLEKEFTPDQELKNYLEIFKKIKR